MSLENTNWTLNDGSGTTTNLAFGASKATAGNNPGGYGTATVQYSSGPIQIDIIWMEDGNGNFMYQTKGPTDPTVDELPTVSGVYRNTTALGWGTNFDAAWGTWEITMKKST